MSGRTFSDEEYAGAYVRIPIGFADRLVVAAQNHMARQSRYIDPEADPITIVGQWLESLERARTMPTPHAEPGDLLVKLARGEFWTFTVHGWRELAPIELQTVADPEQREDARPFEFQDGDPMPQRAKDVGYRNIDRDARAGAGGVCGRHGVYAGVVCPACRREAEERVILAREAVEEAEYAQRFDPRTIGEHGAAEAPRFFGRSVVEDELDRLRGGGVQAAPDPLSPAVRGAFDELQTHAEVLEHVADALAGGDDGGNNSPSFESIAQARTFARALHYAREVIWKHQGAR